MRNEAKSLATFYRNPAATGPVHSQDRMPLSALELTVVAAGCAAVAAAASAEALPQQRRPYNIMFHVVDGNAVACCWARVPARPPAAYRF